MVYKNEKLIFSIRAPYVLGGFILYDFLKSNH